MCVVVTAAVGGVSIVATDTRVTNLHPDGRITYADPGNKLVRLRDGSWMAATGEAEFINRVTSALLDLEWAESEQVRAALAAVLVADERTGYVRERVDRSRFYIARGPACGEFHANGTCGFYGAGRFGYSPPVDHGEADHLMAQCHTRFPAAINAARDEHDLIRACAAEVAFWSEHSPRVSDTVHMGIGNVRMAGPAAQIAVASNADLQRWMESWTDTAPQGVVAH